MNCDEIHEQGISISELCLWIHVASQVRHMLIQNYIDNHRAYESKAIFGIYDHHSLFGHKVVLHGTACFGRHKNHRS